MCNTWTLLASRTFSMLHFISMQRCSNISQPTKQQTFLYSTCHPLSQPHFSALFRNRIAEKLPIFLTLHSLLNPFPNSHQSTGGQSSKQSVIRLQPHISHTSTADTGADFINTLFSRSEFQYPHLSVCKLGRWYHSLPNHSSPKLWDTLKSLLSTDPPNLPTGESHKLNRQPYIQNPSTSPTSNDDAHKPAPSSWTASTTSQSPCFHVPWSPSYAAARELLKHKPINLFWPTIFQWLPTLKLKSKCDVI